MADVTDPVLTVNLGLYTDRAPIQMDERMLSGAWNIRIKNGRIERENLGWGPFPSSGSALNLDGRSCIGIFNFFPSDGGNFLLFFNTTDCFEYDETNTKLLYLTPRYETGTVDVTNGSATVNGTGTSWSGNLSSGDRIHVGATDQREQSATWYEIDSVDSDTELTLTETYNESTSTGEDYTARQTFDSTIDDYWNEASFSLVGGTVGGDSNRPDRIYFCNGIDGIWAWDGDSDQLYAPSLGNLEQARTVTTYKNMLIFGDITLTGGSRRPFSMRNSAIGEPENHTGNEAAELIVHDGVDPILAIATLGDTLTFYGERNITLAQFVGDPILFSFRSAIKGLGPLSGRAVADFGDTHTFLGADAQYTFDGTSLQESGFHVWRETLRTMSPGRLDMVHSHFDEENGELIWTLPLNSDTDSANGAPEQALVEHYLEQVGENDPAPVTRRDFPSTFTGFFQQEESLTWDTIGGTWEGQTLRWDDRQLQALFPLNLFGTADGDIFIYGTQDSQNGADFASYARTGRLPIGDTRHKGVITRVYPFLDELPSASYDLEVYIHTAEQALGNTTEHGPFMFDLAQESTHFVSTRVPARYAELEFRTFGTGRLWRLAGWKIDRKVIGER